jgi:hypothetical protein
MAEDEESDPPSPVADLRSDKPEIGRGGGGKLHAVTS